MQKFQTSLKDFL